MRRQVEVSILSQCATRTNDPLTFSSQRMFTRRSTLSNGAPAPFALLVISALSIVAACDSNRPDKSAAATASTAAPAKTVEFVELTTGGANPSETLPMIIAIHGLGDRPEAFSELFSGFDVKAR